jgi:FtsX-like permease family protein/MacB-like protein/peptidase M28-like protein
MAPHRHHQTKASATLNRELPWVWILVFVIGFVWMLPSGYGRAESLDMEPHQFFEDIQSLSAIGDRSTGTSGNAIAAKFIKNRLITLGFDVVGSQRFAVPIRQHRESRLTLTPGGQSIPILPILGNAVTPQTIPAPGLNGPLIYVGTGEPRAFNGKIVEGSIVLMELESGRNWEYAATMGAQALIYVDRGDSPKMLFEDKFELSPVQFPRFWMPFEQAKHVLGSFEIKPSTPILEQVTLTSDIRWNQTTAENIYCLIPGSDPEFRNEMVLFEAFYDSSMHVAGRSPGADEACSVATLLQFARLMKKHPPQKTILMVASAGHAQTLAGMREFVWGLSEKSKTIKKMKRDLSARIDQTRQTIDGLNAVSFSNRKFPAPDVMRLVDEALKERLKTEADGVSRRLMQARMQTENQIKAESIQTLALLRQQLRRLTWLTSFNSHFSEAESLLLKQIADRATKDQKALWSDAQQQLDFLQDVDRLRRYAREYDLAAAVSLHLSSHGSGVGAFNYGWLYPFRPRINRTPSYSKLDDVLRGAGKSAEQKLGVVDFYKDTLRPSRQGSWKNFFVDRPPLGGEVSALAGYHGLSLVTTHDARASWGTAQDIPEHVNQPFALKQSRLVCMLMQHLAGDARLHEDSFPRNGFATLTGSAKFLRHGELFADQAAPGTVMLAYQGSARYYTIVDQTGRFYLKGLSDSKHSFHKTILEGYKFDTQTGSIIWTIDKKLTNKNAYRVKMRRRSMQTDLKMFASNGTTLFNLLEPRTFRHLTKTQVLDGRREAEPVRYFYSRLDTWSSNISTVFLEPGTPLKITLSDSVLKKKLILLNNSSYNPQGVGYRVEEWPALHRTAYRVAHDMWSLLTPRIYNLEASGIFNARIDQLHADGQKALKQAQDAWAEKRYDRFFEAASKSWALASRVYEDIEKTQKDVLYGVLFYIALFVPFSFCLERLLFSYANIYKRIVAFCAILILLIAVIYNVHPAFQLAYSPMVVILAFLIMGLSLVVTLIIFFRFEQEMTYLQSHSHRSQSEEIGRWKAFVAAFLLGVSNLRRRRVRTALTCITLMILTFTIMSFTSVKSIRRHSRMLYQDQHPYQGLLLKNINWRDLPAQAYTIIENTFAETAITTPRVWLEGEDRTHSTRTPIHHDGKSFVAQGMIGLSANEAHISDIDDILLGGRWLMPEDRQVVLLSDRMADHFGIDIQSPQGKTVSMWGLPYEVVGIFSGQGLQNRKDLDGEPLTPAIFPREISADMIEVVVQALESGDDMREFQSRYQHIDADLTVIVPYQGLLAAGGHIKSIAVRPYAFDAIQETAQVLVDRFGLSLFSGESTGTYLYHASDSMRYSGVPNIIVPILISIFIVLNTMISSVYERKREIGIYTSVGLAPSHVSFLFIAEAMAFAVLSVVFGYLVAQISAKLFAGTALWEGITVNYSSIAGVGAMTLVILVVMVSVIYPSKVAGEIAIPDINRSWTLPEPRENRLEIVLPFLMTYQEHRSVGGFIYEYFASHREITHGKFSVGKMAFNFVCETPPDNPAREEDCPEEACEYEECLHMTSQVWLAPFDFGILQQVTLKFKPAETERGYLEVHVSLKRKSGESNAWHRINKTFLHQVRKQLLIWRSFDDATKQYYASLLAEAAEGTQQTLQTQ